MRILFLSHLYPPYYIGGHEIHCKDVADGLSQKGHEVFVLTSKYGVYNEILENRVLRVLYFYSIGKTTGFRRRYSEIKVAVLGRLNYFITRQIIRQINPDIVYAEEISNISMYPLKAIQNQGIPIVHHLGIHTFVDLTKECILRPNPIKNLYKRIIHGFNGIKNFDFNHIITLSEALKKQHIEVGFPECNISVIPPGIFSELIKDEFKKFTDFSKKEIKLLYVGRINQEKGVHISIEAVGYLVKNLTTINVVLYIIGDGNEKYIDKLQSLISKLKIKKNVRFCGKLPREKVMNEYSKYDILLVPSIWEEPFGIIIIEAMSQGLPVIATSVGGIPEIIKNGETGLLVPPNNPVKMTEAVKKLIDNPHLYERLSINGIKEVQEKYTDEKIIEHIDKYINDVFNQSKRNLI